MFIEGSVGVMRIFLVKRSCAVYERSKFMFGNTDFIEDNYGAWYYDPIQCRQAEESRRIQVTIIMDDETIKAIDFVYVRG